MRARRTPAGGGGVEASSSPLVDKLRLMAVAFTSDGQAERGKGLAQAADVVDQELAALTGRALVEALERMLDRLLEARLEAFVGDVAAAVRDAGAGAALPAPAPPAPSPSPRRGRPVGLPSPPAPRPSTRETGARAVLVAVAQHMPEGVDRSQLSILSGYKKSTRDLYVQQARRAGWLEVDGRRIVATSRGLAELGPSFEPLPTGRALLEHWLDRLPEGERRVLSYVAGYYPHPAARERIGEYLAYSKSTRDLYLQRLERRKLVSSSGRGHVVAAAMLFDGGGGAARAVGGT